MVFGNVNGFWDPMLELIDHMRDQGFVHTAHLVQPLVIDRAEDIVPGILASVRANGREGEAEIISRL